MNTTARYNARDNWYVIILSFIICQLSFSPVQAQKLTGSAPSQVAVGEQFRLTYTVTTQDVDGFRAGNIPDAFDVLMGPSTSRQSSYQIINGHASSSSSITYTYILSAVKSGTFTIPPANVTINGKSIASNALKIIVSGQSGTGSSGGNQQRHGNGQQQMRSAGTPISSGDLFIKVSANKKHVHEQEPILLTYKVYTLVDLTQLEGKMPDLKGFHTQEIPLPQQKTFKIEQHNGRPYRTVTWSQYVMFPQITGKLEIPSITFNGIVVQQNRNIDPFEAFFNGGSGYVEVKKQITAPGLIIQVDPLPARPTGFSGGVGVFNISASLDKNKVKANDPVTLRIVVSGTGNLKLIKEPVVNIPKDFDKYDAKVTDKTKLSLNGLEGSMVYDFLIVPRHQGKYDIPPVEYTYYDIRSNSYKTVKTDGFTLDVEKGDGNATAVYRSSQEDLRLLNKDIRYIKTGTSDLHKVNTFFFGSTRYWIVMVVLVCIFVSLFVIFRKRAVENANITKKRAGRANKVAAKRLKKSVRLRKEGKSGEFYDEVLRALWGYVGDKLNIPVEQLNRENISQKLTERSVNADTVNMFLTALDECEFERYAPGDASGNMEKTYNAALTAIEKIEGTIKKAVVLLCLFAFLPLSSFALTKAEADSAYARQQYQQAITAYESLLKNGVSAEIYYNLGNAYYRTDNITRAVLNYERALLLSPGDEDIRFNLQMARSKTIDRITPETELFFVTWYHSIVNSMNVDGWAKTSLLALAFAIVLALIYLFSDRLWIRKLGFFGGVFFVLIFILSNVFAYQQKQTFTSRSGAIVISSAVTVKSTPAQNGTDLFILHEGTKITVIDSQMKDWKKIKVADGKEGWIETSKIELI